MTGLWLLALPPSSLAQRWVRVPTPARQLGVSFHVERETREAQVQGTYEQGCVALSFPRQNTVGLMTVEVFSNCSVLQSPTGLVSFPFPSY